MPFAEGDDGQIVVREADAAIYPAIKEDMRRAGGQFLLLTGDQIYADELKPISVRDALSDDANDPLPDDELLARYRRNYRGFFNQTGIRGASRIAANALYLGRPRYLRQLGLDGREVSN